MKIVFFGTPNFIEPVIKVLDEKFEILETFRKPIDFDQDLIKKFEDQNPDLFVVAAYGKILPIKVLNIPRLGSINIHPSLLPIYRGPSPIQTAILNGDEKSGITFIKMDEQIDHGPIIKQSEGEIKSNDTFNSLAEKLFQMSAEQIEEVIKSFEENQIGKKQNESDATFTKIFKKEDGYVNLNISIPDNLENKIRALYPWPGVWTKFDLTRKETIIKFLPGKRIQVEGKKPMTYKDFKNGYEKGEELIEKLNLNES